MDFPFAEYFLVLRILVSTGKWVLRPLKDLKAKVERLEERVERFGAVLDALPGRLEVLTARVEGNSRDVARLEGRVEELSRRNASSRAEAPSPPPQGGPEPPPTG